MSKLLNILIAVTVAVPLGAGGLCCCLFLDRGDEALLTEGASSCCAGEAVPVSTPECPNGNDAGDCSCPERETALVGKTGATLASASVTTIEFGAGSEAFGEEPRSETKASSRKLHPPPQRALHETHCVFLC